MTEDWGPGITAAHWAALARLVVDGAALEALEALRRAGLETVLLKGPSIAGWLYDSNEVRRYVDGDLLVKEPDRAGAEKVLSSLGFERDRDITWIGGWIGSAQPWRRIRDAATIDLHVSMPGVGVEPQQLWEVLSGEFETMHLRGTDVSVLSPAARALHLALHVSQHDGRLATPLRDLELAVARLDQPTWQHTAVLAGRLEAMPALTLGLLAVPQGGGLAQELGLPTAREARRSIQRTRLKAALHALGAAPSFRVRTRMVVTKIVPSPAFMRNWSGLGRFGPLGLALAYAWRPLWLLGRTITALLGRPSREAQPRDRDRNRPR